MEAALILSGIVGKALESTANQWLPGLFGYQCLYLARPGDEKINNERISLGVLAAGPK